MSRIGTAVRCGAVTGMLVTAMVGRAAEDPPPAAAADTAIGRIEAAGGAVRRVSRDKEEVEVDLRGATVTDADLAVLAAIPHLHTLRLNDTAIGDAGLANVARIASLERLFLDRTAVTDAGLGQLASLAKLQFLCLYGTAIGDPALGTLAKFPGLKTVIVTATKVTSPAAVAFRKAHPGIGIIPDLPGGHERALTAHAAALKAVENAEAEVAALKSQLEESASKGDAIKAEAEAATKKVADAKSRLAAVTPAAAEAGKKAGEEKKKADALAKQAAAAPDDKSVAEQARNQAAEAEQARKDAAEQTRLRDEAQAAVKAAEAEVKELAKKTSQTTALPGLVKGAQKRLEAMRELAQMTQAHVEASGKQLGGN